LINKIAKLALKTGQIQGLKSIDAGVIRQISSRFDRVSKAVLPKRRERVRDGSAIVRGHPGGTMLPEERTSPPLSRLTPPLTGMHEPEVRPESAGNLGEGSVPVVVTADQQPMQPLMADMLKFSEPIYLKARVLSTDQRMRLAEQLAAGVLKRYQHLIQQLGCDTKSHAWLVC
jgi:hypothetical protein